jgi:hypothetical protein
MRWARTALNCHLQSARWSQVDLGKTFCIGKHFLTNAGDDSVNNRTSRSEPNRYGALLTVIIKRIQVEGGFLDGLDIRLEHGLNVLIGGRGTGKSSVIELIRYCLDVKGSGSEDDATRSREQALSVLQDGQANRKQRSGGT